MFHTIEFSNAQTKTYKENSTNIIDLIATYSKSVWAHENHHCKVNLIKIYLPVVLLAINSVQSKIWQKAKTLKPIPDNWGQGINIQQCQSFMFYSMFCERARPGSSSTGAYQQSANKPENHEMLLTPCLELRDTTKN